jgi:hypothetical protein
MVVVDLFFIFKHTLSRPNAAVFQKEPPKIRVTAKAPAITL